MGAVLDGAVGRRVRRALNRVELYVHLVWGTRGRRPLVTEGIEKDVFGLIAAKTTELRCVPCAIGGTADHAHLLASLHPSVSVARLVGEVKGASSHFVNHRLDSNGSFGWQSGFGAFTIATADVPAVSNYLRAQKEHHAKRALESTLELADDS